MGNWLRFAPWIATIGITWSLGFIYNVYYGGELSWLRKMYYNKIAIASQVEAPRRLLIMGGSGANFSVNSEVLEKELGFPVINLGLDGPVGVNVIFPSMLKAVRPGDMVLLVPEDLLLFDDDGLLDRSATFGIATGKPGLGGVSAKKLAQTFWTLGVPGLQAVTKSTVDLITKGELTGYYSPPLTDHGDPSWTRYRQNQWDPLKMRRTISPHVEKRITQFREEVEAKGGTLVLSLPWMYASTDAQSIANQRKTAKKLEKIAPTIYNPVDYNLKPNIELFADTHHHLLPEVKVIRSQEIARQLQPILKDLDKAEKQ